MSKWVNTVRHGGVVVNKMGQAVVELQPGFVFRIKFTPSKVRLSAGKVGQMKLDGKEKRS